MDKNLMDLLGLLLSKQAAVQAHCEVVLQTLADLTAERTGQNSAETVTALRQKVAAIYEQRVEESLAHFAQLASRHPE